MARPRAEIDKLQFEKLCALQCTEEDIADIMNVSVDTLQRWCKRTYNMNFANIFALKRKRGYVKLRMKMFESAMNGNTTMMIFLAKNYLGMSDKVNQKLEINSYSDDEAVKEIEAFVENSRKEFELEQTTKGNRQEPV